jgi:hypothetical protein
MTFLITALIVVGCTLFAVAFYQALGSTTADDEDDGKHQRKMSVILFTAATIVISGAVQLHADYTDQKHKAECNCESVEDKIVFDVDPRFSGPLHIPDVDDKIDLPLRMDADLGYNNPAGLSHMDDIFELFLK